MLKEESSDMKFNKVVLVGIISLVAVIAAAGIAGAAYGDKRGFREARFQAFQTGQQMTCGHTAGDRAQAKGRAKGFAQSWGGQGFALMESAADLLGLEPRELKEELQSGKSLAEIAQDKGISQETLIEKIQAALTANLDQAVANEKIPAETAAKIKENLTQRITDMVTREHPARQTAPGQTVPQAEQTSNT
jgi:uncharacterized protein YidB (DUF937 family)